MTTIIKSTQINIGSLGVIDLNIPKIVLESPNSGPKIVLLAVQHGNETTPLFVLKKLLKILEQRQLLRGSIVIMPVANPLGLIFDSRREPLDGDDLNRMYPGSRKNLGKRIAKTVFDECLSADLVIDLHTFQRQSKILGVLVKSNDELEEKSKKILSLIKPDLIWQIDMNRFEDKRFEGSLDLLCLENEMPAITIEMERLESIASEKIDRVAEGILNLLISTKIINGNIMPACDARIPIFEADYLYFDDSGLFLPQVSLLEEVKVGAVLGTITDLKTFAEKPIKSPIAGTLMTIRFKDVVRCGSKLGSIGQKIGEL